MRRTGGVMADRWEVGWRGGWKLHGVTIDLDCKALGAASQQERSRAERKLHLVGAFY